MDTDSPVGASASVRQVKNRRERKRFLSLSVIAAFVFGILFVSLFNMAMDWTNTEEFCIGCHEMKENTYREYQDSAHFTNRSGVRAVCGDCHVPKEFFPKIARKLKAATELWHSIRGTIDTPEKFEERRAQMAQNEWRRMKANDSKACRNCHDANSFDYSSQRNRAVDRHQEGLSKGETCIDCHQGIVHQMPQIDQVTGMADLPGIASEIFGAHVPKTPVRTEKTAE
ncbi:MAG: NapC/NirT family cytochrome c [Azoarcus sp.]|jgi:cytochrome c-type protein NapC|nr:NapC/NirT family cytochrome c [Azoarcus sp.]